MQLTANGTLPLEGFRLLVVRGLARICTVVVAIAENNARVRRVEALNRLSDAQLARAGLRREDIVQHVFRDVLHL